MTQEQAKKMTEWMYRCPYESAAGIVPVSLTEGRSVIGVTLRPDHMNIWNIPHGGLLYALADIASGVAADSVHPDAHVVTAGSCFNFLYAAPDAKSLRAVGQVIKPGHSLTVVQADVYDDRDRHLATGQFTMHLSYDTAGAHSQQQTGS